MRAVEVLPSVLAEGLRRARTRRGCLTAALATTTRPSSTRDTLGENVVVLGGSLASNEAGDSSAAASGMDISHRGFPFYFSTYSSLSYLSFPVSSSHSFQCLPPSLPASVCSFFLCDPCQCLFQGTKADQCRTRTTQGGASTEEFTKSTPDSEHATTETKKERLTRVGTPSPSQLEGSSEPVSHVTIILRFSKSAKIA